jgi:hypothetical protein
VVLAVGYGAVLGCALEVPEPGRTLPFVRFFAGLGAGVAFAVRRHPASAGIGALASVLVPPLLARFGARTG